MKDKEKEAIKRMRKTASMVGQQRMRKGYTGMGRWRIKTERCERKRERDN